MVCPCPFINVLTFYGTKACHLTFCYRWLDLFISIFIYILSSAVYCLQCFDAVGWAAGRASGEVQTCTWPSRCHCHSLSLASVKSPIGFSFLVPAHLGSPGQRAVKRVCVTFTIKILLKLMKYECKSGYIPTLYPFGRRSWSATFFTTNIKCPTSCNQSNKYSSVTLLKTMCTR